MNRRAAGSVTLQMQLSIVRMLADGQFHSGEKIADSLGVSRAAIWKHLSQIRERMGIEVFAVRGKGYKLSAPLELLDTDQICSKLGDTARELLSELEILDRIDSTNSYLLALIPEGIASGYVCISEQQTAGRGRMGRRWVSPFGSNIYLSIHWQYPLPIAELSGLSLAAGVAVARCLESLGLEGIELKWPNDVLWQNRKLAGLLLEVSGERNRLQKFANKIGGIEHESDVSDLMTFSYFFLGGLLLGQFSLLFGDLRITLGNAGGLLLTGILMGFFRARNPTFGYIPQGAINVLKDLGLNIFMVGVGLAAGADILDAFQDSGLTVLLGGACIMLLPL